MLNLPYSFEFEGQKVAWGTIGEGKPLVLIHGTPFSSQVWRKIAPLLANHWKIYFFDLLGYGMSEKRLGQNVSLEVQNNLLAALFIEWGLDTPEVLCHDFGGTTALRAYYLNGIRYSKLTIIDPVAIAPWGSPFVQHVRQYEEAFSGLPEFAHNALLRSYLQSSTYSILNEESLQVYMNPWQGKEGQAAFYRQIAQMDQYYTDQIEELYTSMDNIIRILWGENDQWIPLSQGKKFADRVANGNLIIVPNSGHLMQEDAPEAIVAAMLN
ncbi:alpha/beta fold hydrolase [Photobacterium indicum]|uniref:alpha/beta fold hydrolase n=1 Tax=Photobacterium indicum TaxID=81447 RepID=UPI003D151775